MGKKNRDDDSGVSFANMDLTRANLSEDKMEQLKEIQGLKLTKKEKIAIFFGIMKAVIPALLCVLISFGIIIYLVTQWLT